MRAGGGRGKKAQRTGKKKRKARVGGNFLDETESDTDDGEDENDEISQELEANGEVALNADGIEGGGEVMEVEVVEDGGGELVENAVVIEGNEEIVDAGENREVVNLDVTLFNEDLELFNAFYFANWRFVAKQLGTTDRKKIFSAVEKEFDRTRAALKGAPRKRPPSVFVIFSKHKYSEVAQKVKEGGQVSSKDVQKETSKELGRIWRTMSKEEKEPFVKEAADLKREFFGLK